MRTSIRYLTISRISGAVAGLWLCGAGAAWAGGGADFGSLTALLTTGPGGTTGICDVFHINPCPKVPSITQAALEVAALGNNLSEMLLLQNQFAPASRVNANNPPAVPVADANGNPHPIPFPLNSTTFPPLFVAATPGTKTTPATPASGLLSTLTPLAFISQSLGTAQAPGTAPVTQLYDTSADAFLYAVGLSTTSNSAIGSTGVPLPVPNYVYFFYDDLFRFNLSFTTGSTIAKFTFPLRVVANDGTERAVPTTLNFVATNAGDCSMSTVVGDFDGMGTSPPPTLTPDQVGIDCQVVLSASPASTQQHVVFEVKVPLLVTKAGLDPASGQCSTSAAKCPDPLYFYSFATPKDSITHKALSNPINSTHVTQGVFTAFEQSTGHSPTTGSTYLGTGTAIGLAPSAAPLCSDLFGSVGCPATPVQPTFPLCANLPTKNSGNSVPLRPAVGAYYAMATSGETLLSAALGTASNSACSLF